MGAKNHPLSSELSLVLIRFDPLLSKDQGWEGAIILCSLPGLFSLW